MIIGDFNSNAAWDKPDRWWNHSDVVAELKELNIKSLYHTHFQEAQGRESLPTFYLYRKEKKPYHIDYAFCYSEILKRSTIQIGDKSDWLKLSDHMPLIVDIV